MTEPAGMSANTKRISLWEGVVLVCLILTLAAGAYLRLVGVNWDEDQHMHPDERFLSLVQVAISPVENASAYFDTENSSLNPENRGYTFFVYGTLPIFIIRYVGEALGQTDYHAITILGRYLSAIFDLITALLVYAVGRRLYQRWVGLLGALFYALAVLPIQLSHYMTVDTITNTFAFLAVYAAVWALTRSPSVNKDGIGEVSAPDAEPDSDADLVLDSEADLESSERAFTTAKLWRVFQELAPYLVFGAALGAATASKINAVVLAIILPLVEGVRYLRMTPDDRREALGPIFRNLFVAGILSFLIFRIGQPYAFNGPGFFNIGISENWWMSLQNLRAQASGKVDFPPALQWARRPITFSLQNLIIWGLGLPLGVLAWLSYLAMGWRMIWKREWAPHLPLWLFTGLYFAWQSFSWVRSMRYQMLIYPALALFAGWGLVQMWSARREIKIFWLRLRPQLLRLIGIVLTVIVILTTAAYAFAFTRIYAQPHTRVAASRWIYQNIPGALTLELETPEGSFLQPLPYRAGDKFDSQTVYRLPFYGAADGLLTMISFPHILDENQLEPIKQLTLTVVSADAPENILATAELLGEFLPSESDWRGAAYDFVLDQAVPISEDALYYLQLELIEAQTTLVLNGAPTLTFLANNGMTLRSPLPRIQQGIRQGTPYQMTIQLVKSGVITHLHMPYLVDQMGKTGTQTLTVELQLPDQPTRSVTLNENFLPGEDIRGKSYTIELVEPFEVTAGEALMVTLSTDTPGAWLTLHAPAPVHESSWDDAIPYPVDGFSPYSETGGIYRGDLNFEMYWPDDANKLARFETLLDSGDYIFITSNRQWGTTTRVPERYLLTTAFYRNLLGCPDEKEVTWCYAVAEPGMFEERLGFELVQTFHSNPNIGPFELNSQFAEEAFTVYDHPKVLIFRKTGAYDPVNVREILRAVDLSKVVYFTPGDAASYRGPDPDQVNEPRYNLSLSEDRLSAQRQGGTWSDLFNVNSALNTSPFLAAAALYGFVLLLGILCYPIVRLALPGLEDKGYPLSKLAGLLILAFGVWILGSAGVAFTLQTILVVLVVISLVSAVFIFLQRKSLWAEIQAKWQYYLAVEVLALVAFIAFILIRMGNPDLWHPYKGGEKPMDFSYLNAILKSTTFPPYDPWFAGGYINYYYYGFVIAGVPIKLLGIVPAVAYNIILPIWFSLLAQGAFSVGWNLFMGIPRPRALRVGERSKGQALRLAFVVGVITVLLLAVIGNLGTLRLIAEGYQRLASGGASLADAGLGQRIAWTLQGFVQFLRGAPMPFYPGDWYWFPSRVIPGEAITEFPYFTFIYGDFHAHLIAFPITVFAISWSLSIVLNKAQWGEGNGRLKWVGAITGWVLGALVIGALRPTNTWDFYTYIVLASIAVFYSVMRYYQPKLKIGLRWGAWLEKACVAIASVLGLVLLATLLYQPFSYWYGQGYTQVELWRGDRTPLSSYFTHWGVFLFIITSWMSWETYHWMKTTPQSALKRLEPYLTWIYASLVLFLLLLLVFLVMEVVVAAVIVPLGVWVILLMFRPGRSDGMRFLLFMIGTALTLSLVVELVYLQGDIGRMNTVFKFYLQAWILFGLSAGVCLVWLVQSIRYWNDRLSFGWQTILFFLLTSAALYTMMGTTDKIHDRMTVEAPHTLDGMAYMLDASYYDLGVEMVLAEDYHAIRWMQENIQGSPVILEGQAYEYRWGNRYTIYTGLPGVVGWNWHQRQQRAVLRNNVVQERVDAVNQFYTTEDIAFVINFMKQYDVKYIVLGQLERIFYPGPGLDKFAQFEGVLWEKVYHSGQTVIYSVLD